MLYQFLFQTTFYLVIYVDKTPVNKKITKKKKKILLIIQEYFLLILDKDVKSLIPAQDHFPAQTAFHDFEALLEFDNTEAVRNHRSEVEARDEHLLHLVPRLPHLAPIDTFKCQRFEDDFVPIDSGIIGKGA